MCYHAEFGRTALNGVGVSTGKPPKLGSAGTQLSWDGRRDAWLTPTYTPLPHVCYHVKYGSSVIKDVRINRKESKKNVERPVSVCPSVCLSATAEMSFSIMRLLLEFANESDIVIYRYRIFRRWPVTTDVTSLATWCYANITPAFRLTSSVLLHYAVRSPVSS